MPLTFARVACDEQMTGHEQAMPTLEEIQKGLAGIRRARRTLWSVFFGSVAAMGMVAWASGSDYAGVALGVLWIIPFIWAGSKVVGCRCPRCGNEFHRVRSPTAAANPWTRHCLHCGLSLRSGD